MDLAWTGSQLHPRKGGSGSQGNRPETPESRHETPESRHETPESRHETPKCRHETPESRHETPESRHETPESQHETPESRHETPESRRETPESRHETPANRHETPANRHETPANRPGSGSGGADRHVDGKKVRVVQYPYKPLLPRDGFSWVKYGQKKLTTGDNMISAACWDPSASPAQLPQFLLSLSPFPPTHDACRLYFQCGLRTSHACPARRTVDLSCWDPSAPLVLNYHCTHNHLPHYHVVGAATTSPAPLPKDRSVKVRSVRTRGSAAVPAGATAAAAATAAADGADSSMASKRAAVKEEAIAANGTAGRPLRCPPSFLPALASIPVSGATWKDKSDRAPSRPSSNASSSSGHAPASAVADWRAALEALLSGSPVPAVAPTPAPASSDKPVHARESTVSPLGSRAAAAAPSPAPASSDKPAHARESTVSPLGSRAAAAAPLHPQSHQLPAEVIAALTLLVQSALAEGGHVGAEESESVPAEGTPQQQQQQEEEEEELPGLEDTDCLFPAAPLTPAFQNPTSCPPRSFCISENLDDAGYFQEMSPGGGAAAADTLAAAAELHLLRSVEVSVFFSMAESSITTLWSWKVRALRSSRSDQAAQIKPLRSSRSDQAAQIKPLRSSRSDQAAQIKPLRSSRSDQAAQIKPLRSCRSDNAALCVTHILSLRATSVPDPQSLPSAPSSRQVRELTEKEKEGSVFQLPRARAGREGEGGQCVPAAAAGRDSLPHHHPHRHHVMPTFSLSALSSSSRIPLFFLTHTSLLPHAYLSSSCLTTILIHTTFRPLSSPFCHFHPNTVCNLLLPFSRSTFAPPIPLFQPSHAVAADSLVNIWATALVTDAATALFGEAGVSAATGVMTILLLVFTEIAPKSIAVHNATQVVRVVLRPVAWLSVVLYPVGRLCTYASTGLFRLLGLKTSGEPFVTEEELKLMLRGAEMSGAIEEEEQDMIENVLEIKDTYVREVMTPLVDVVAVGSSASLMELRALWVRHQYSRVPVYERRVDNIVGIAYAMDMLDYVEQPELLHRLSVGRIAHRPAYFVPDSMSVWNLLREFRIRKVHMAIVLNEYGGTVGLVTLEDAVEEIVGEIFDENDSKEEIRRKTGYIIQRAEGVYDVDANTTVDDLADILQVVLPPRASFYETVSGFVCEAFGYIPRTGDTKIIRLQRKESEEEEEGDGAEEGGAGGKGGKGRERDGGDKGTRKQLLRFQLEILSGNARKVVAVRFEELKETEGASGGGVKGKLGAGKEEEDIEKETERKREKDRERALVEEWESEKRREGRRKERISQEVRSRGLGEVGRGEGEGMGEGESKCETCEQMKLGRGKAGGRGVLLDSESEGEEGEVLMGGGWLTGGDGEEGGYSEGVLYTDSDMGERDSERDGVGESGSERGSGKETEGGSVRRGEGGTFDGSDGHVGLEGGAGGGGGGVREFEGVAMAQEQYDRWEEKEKQVRVGGCLQRGWEVAQAS
ncbi:unnamed protein product [Closterium sp. Naga37s-1]|nr:unnamed protein product [Closterium sp. Naga37s-1]